MPMHECLHARMCVLVYLRVCPRLHARLRACLRAHIQGRAHEFKHFHVPVGAVERAVSQLNKLRLALLLCIAP